MLIYIYIHIYIYTTRVNPVLAWAQTPAPLGFSAAARTLHILAIQIRAELRVRLVKRDACGESVFNYEKNEVRARICNPYSEVETARAKVSPRAVSTAKKSEVDALGVITISRGCFERCCSNKKTSP